MTLANILTWVLFSTAFVDGYKKFDLSSSAESYSNFISQPLTSRLKKLPARYSQHYFKPFQPFVESETKTRVRLPSNAANFFSPQSYWGQLANKIVDNVVQEVGGVYGHNNKKNGSTPVKTSENTLKKALKELVKPDASDEKLDLFKKALKMENSTRFRTSTGYPEYSPKNSGVSTDDYVSVNDLSSENSGKNPDQPQIDFNEYNVLSSRGLTSDNVKIIKPLRNRQKLHKSLDNEATAVPAAPESTPAPKKRRPIFWRDNERVRFIDQDSRQVLSAAKIVRPTTVHTTTTVPSTTPATTTSTTASSEYGVLPTLLLKNPNARSKFYHLDKYANPQYHIRKIIRYADSDAGRSAETTASGVDGLNPAIIAARKRIQDLRRKQARIFSKMTSPKSNSPKNLQLDENLANQIRFRSALKRILADFRKHKPAGSSMKSRAKERELIQLQRLAQLKASRANRRRHPGMHLNSGNRRVVMLPARYEEDNEGPQNWRH